MRIILFRIKQYILAKIKIGDFMIDSFEIIKQNGEEVLYIYLDINSEFAKKVSHKKNYKLAIKEFIEKNKITFAGSMIVVAIGGLVIGNYYLKNNKINDFDNSVAITELLLNEEPSIIKESEIIDNEEITPTNDENVSKENNKSENSSKKNNKKMIIQKETSNTINEQKVVENIPIEQKTEEEQEEITDNKTYVTIKRSSGALVTLELEEYLAGVVAAEMPAEFNEETLKAQAVIARTYTLKALQRNQTLGDTEATQSYKDQDQLKILWGSKFSTYYNKIKKCVDATKGSTLKYNNTYIEAVYHSTSNGMTENAINVWGNAFPYLVSVESPYDTFNKSFIMEKNMSYVELSSKLGIDINEETEFKIIEKTESGRVKNIEVGNQIFTGVNFRSKLGLRSTDFEINKTDNGVIFKTKGYGHGVGMSQYGANGMASAGYNYSQILLHYYPGTNLSYQ